MWIQVTKNMNENKRKRLTPYQEGYKAYFNEFKEEDNPYLKSNIDHKSWNDGYWDARAISLKDEQV
jgi:hypothetical protein